MPKRPLTPCLYPGCRNLVKRGFCDEHRYPINYYPKLKKGFAIDVVMVCGPPASGKSTFVDKNRKDGDVVIDLDVIKSEITGKPLHSRHDELVLDRAIEKRNKTLMELQDATGDKTLWFIVGGGYTSDRLKWVSLLQPKEIYVMQATIEECFRRIERRKSETEEEQKNAVLRWFDNYEPLPGEIIINTTISSGEGCD